MTQTHDNNFACLLHLTRNSLANRAKRFKILKLARRSSKDAAINSDCDKDETSEILLSRKILNEK